MARFKTILTDTGAILLTQALARSEKVNIDSVQMGSGIYDGDHAKIKELVSVEDLNTTMGDRQFINGEDGEPSLLKISVQTLNDGLTKAVPIREIGLFAESRLFAYAWIDGEDTDNILPPPLDINVADTIHQHELVLFVTNQENASIDVKFAFDGFVSHRYLTERLEEIDNRTKVDSHIENVLVHISEDERVMLDNLQNKLDNKADLSQPNFKEAYETTAEYSEDLKTEALFGTGWSGTMPTFTTVAGSNSVLSFPMRFVNGNLYEISFDRTGTSATNHFNIILTTDQNNTIGQEVISNVHENHTLYIRANNDYTHLNIVPMSAWAGNFTLHRVLELKSTNTKTISINDLPVTIKNKNILLTQNSSQVAGENNVVIGDSSLPETLRGDKNIIIGADAGTLRPVINDSVIIGTGAEAGADAANQIVIGEGAVGINPNTITLGNSKITQLRCQVTTITALSDKRVKEHVEPANLDTCYDTIKRLPVTRYKYKDFTGTHLDNNVTGFMAEDVEKVFPKSVTTSDRLFPVLDKNNNQVYEEKTVIENVEETYEELEEILINEVDPKTKKIKQVTKKVPVQKTRTIEKEVIKKVPKMFKIEDVKEITMTEAIPTLWGALQNVIEKLEKQQEIIDKLKK